MRTRHSPLLLICLALAACDGTTTLLADASLQEGSVPDPDAAYDVAPQEASPETSPETSVPPKITKCADIDTTNLSESNVDTYIKTWTGVACVEDPPDGDPGSMWECQYGGDLLVCNASSGLKLLNCNCTNGAFGCQSGLVIKANQEKVSCPAGDIGPD